MSKSKSLKLICTVFTIMIMISGVCLDEVQASSYFSCRQDVCIRDTESAVIQDVPACRTVQLNQREVISSIRQMRMMNRGMDHRLEQEMGLCYFDIDVLPQKILEVAADYTCSSSDQLYTISIIDFIHSQDGEKLNVSDIA